MDPFGTDNNFGFNIINFEPRLIKEFHDDVFKDYEQSFIGAFSISLM
jgi:hypothetical protein